MASIAPSNATQIGYVTLRFPPMSSSGTRRVEAVLQYLPEHGFRVRVLTLPSDWMIQQGGSPEVAITPDIAGAIRPVAPHDRIIRALSRVRGVAWLQRETVIPDILAPWSRCAARTATDPFSDCRAVYATSPPFSALIIGQRLARALGVPFVAEIRDPPSFSRSVSRRSRLTRMRMRRFEGKYLKQAERVITVTAGTRSRLLSLHSQLDPAKVAVVTNGYPEIEPDVTRADRDWNRFTVAYVGSYQGDSGSRRESWFTPTIVIPSLSALGGPSELRVVGPVTEGQQKHLISPSQNLTITRTGRVDRESALAEMAAADVVLVIADSEHPWWIGRKVFEAGAYAKRILAVVPEGGDTAALLSGSTKAWIVPPGDHRRLSKTIEEIWKQWRRDDAPPQGPIPGLQTDRSSVAEIATVLHQALASSQR